MKLKFYLSILIIMALMVSCKSKENTTVVKETIVIENKKDQTVFFFFEVFKKKDTYKISLVKQQITLAKLKGVFRKEIPVENRKNEHWLISFKNENQDNIQIQIANPLIQKYEVGNTDGTLSSGTIFHDKVTFVVRIPYNTRIDTIVFEKIIKDKNNLEFLDQITL